eukprot:CAMPEP_0198256600 /NCGR_PEP_ID=MMETSP1447-20131203/6485_1 /TAXON_ID=420782 /ORGANISM="Chaetoceros dichaeta, Strain CCMP1751" /LENGTH=997 /DNA_ID=CAMNT_0043943295 /DNA_START=33 /DNA_END=3026 /DNA_ORIENTATION=+
MSERKQIDTREEEHRPNLPPGIKLNLERRLILSTEMEAVGLSSYKVYLKRKLIDQYDEDAIMRDYIDRGYPSLAEVVRVLITYTRKSMLREVCCWNEEDNKYIEFVAGTSAEFSNIDSVKSKIIQDQDQRNTLLKNELEKHGISYSSVEQLHTALRFSATYAMKTFIESGIGHVEKLASVMALYFRYEEADNALCTSNIKLPFINVDALIQKQPDDIKEILRMKNKNCDKRIISWILGSDSTPIKELVIKLKAERPSRQHLVDAHAAAWCIDISAISLYHRLVKDLEKFVRDNHGDLNTIMSLFVLDEEMDKSGLPHRTDFIRKKTQHEEKFHEFRCDKKEEVHSFIKQLKEERDSRYAVFLKDFTGILIQQQGIQVRSVSEKMKRDIKATDFVRFGTGLLTEAIQSTLKSIRGQILQKTIHEATPSVSCSNLIDRTNYDSRCDEFIEGRSPMTAENLVVLWQVEKSLRCKEIEGILKKDSTIIGNLKPCEISILYEAFIKGDSRATIVEIIHEARTDQLRRELRNNYIYCQDIVDLPDFKNYLEGSTHYSATDIVSSFLTKKKIRLQKLRLDEMPSAVNPATIRSDGFSKDWKSYINRGEGSIRWIVDAISFISYREQCATSFDELGLPEPSYSNVCEWRDIHSYSVKALLYDVLYSPLKSADSISLTHKTSEENSLVQLIAAYAEPTYIESIKLGLKNVNFRIVALLTSEWKSVNQAVAALRLDRKNRIKEIDGLFPNEETPDYHWSLNFCGTEQDKEDAISKQKGARADFINGIISLEDAIRILPNEKRKKMLKDALVQGSLHEELMVTNTECKAFVNAIELPDIHQSLYILVIALKNERSKRCSLLNDAFNSKGVIDLGIGICSYYGAISDREQYYFVELYDNNSDFPSELNIRSVRFGYVDLGKGLPEDVVNLAIMYYRTKALTKLLDNYLKTWSPREIKVWIHDSKSCKDFVAKKNTAFPTENELVAFTSSLPPYDDINKVYSESDSGGHY